MIASIPLFLLAVGVGYFVALKAMEEIGFLKHLGNVLAGVIIILSLLGVVYLGFALMESKDFSLWKCPFQKTTSVEQEKSN